MSEASVAGVTANQAATGGNARASSVSSGGVDLGRIDAATVPDRLEAETRTKYQTRCTVSCGDSRGQLTPIHPATGSLGPTHAANLKCYCPTHQRLCKRRLTSWGYSPRSPALRSDARQADAGEVLRRVDRPARLPKVDYYAYHVHPFTNWSRRSRSASRRPFLRDWR